MLHDRGEEWRQSIRNEAAIATCKKHIELILKSRFGNVPLSIIDLINNENDPNRLDTILLSTVNVDSIDAFYNIISNKAHA